MPINVILNAFFLFAAIDYIRAELINNEVMRIIMVLCAIVGNLHKIRAYDINTLITELNIIVNLFIRRRIFFANIF